ncbi:dihydrodipicolinate synthase family protein [Kitasatospora viridis]|uniref:4-hydroxy-tetrahydrodipicolinate synthase n=1 Tax=Kitasatospora viridis TaxID=281105 RepID=A0A561UPA3_9ACTN|nr:dihydrodipicolinate synthase family protein [Kitasatospora viridis]TWG01206.1 4-hydroxy-tetrahydrodipicolinate synthase [Kitasatospora viridis]
MYRGVTAALVTPLTPAGAVAEADVARLVGSLRDHVAALLATLSTGEGWALTPEQWRDMVAATVRHAQGVPVLAGIELPTTAQVVERIAWARELGAAAVVATTPYGPEVEQAEMVRHFAALAAAGLPVLVYHESELSGNKTELATLLEICRIPGVVGVKDSSNSVEFIKELIAAEPGVAVYQGMEELLLDSGPVDGYVIALSCVEPAFCAGLFQDPAPAKLPELLAMCKRYGLDREDWYVAVKDELHRRGVLSSARTVSG